MAVPFAFQIHHIFPKELFDDPRIAERLPLLLAETSASFTMDMAGKALCSRQVPLPCGQAFLLKWTPR